MRRHNQRVAVVTGAGQGIGEATARRLAADGVSVAVVDVCRAMAERVVADIRTKDAVALAYECDVSDSPAVERMIDTVVHAYGGLDVVVNSAGVTRNTAIGYAISDDNWDSVVDIQLKGTFLVCRAALRHMVPVNRGRIVNMGGAPSWGDGNQAHYSAAATGIAGLTAALAREVGAYGITVNAVAPGLVLTPGVKAANRRRVPASEATVDTAEQTTSTGIVARPSDIASVIAFLASDDATCVNGQTIVIADRPPVLHGR